MPRRRPTRWPATRSGRWPVAACRACRVSAAPATDPTAPTDPAASASRRRTNELYEGIVQDLIDELGRLPGVGPKGAQRIAFHLLQAEPADVRRLAEVLMEVKLRVRFCATCFNVSESEQCRIC